MASISPSICCSMYPEFENTGLLHISIKSVSSYKESYRNKPNKQKQTHFHSYLCCTYFSNTFPLTIYTTKSLAGKQTLYFLTHSADSSHSNSSILGQFVNVSLTRSNSRLHAVIHTVLSHTISLRFHFHTKQLCSALFFYLSPER